MTTLLSNYFGDSITLFSLSNGLHKEFESGLYNILLGNNPSAYNANLLAGLILMSLALIYLLLSKRQIFKTKLAIPITCTIFILTPIRLRYAMEWPNHANWAWIVFYLTFLLLFLKNPFSKSFKYPILAGIFFCVALITNAYHGVMLIFISIPLFLYSFYFYRLDILKKENISKILTKFLVFSVIVSSAIYYQYYLYSKPVQYGDNAPISVTSLSRSSSDRWAFSARPWNYLIPDIDHPVFGDLATKVHFWIWQHPPYYLTEPFFPKEHTLFLGYTLMALSIYTIWQTFVKKNITGDQKFNVNFFLIIAVSAFIFSMPPYIGINNFKIYFPSHFIYDFLPQFRAYARYGVFVFIGNAILAVIGLEHLISKSFINKSHQRLKQNLLAIAISALAIFEFIPGKHLISIKPTPPYEWLRQQSTLQQAPLKYIEIPERADYTDHLYTYNANIEIINPYLITRGDAKLLEDIILKRENILIPASSKEKEQLFCNLSNKIDVQYIFYHEKELNRQKYVQKFMETGVVTHQLKVAMAESWGSPVFGNHVPKTDEDLAKEQITKNMKNFLLNDPKLILIKEYTNDEIIQSRPNENFSADKFDAVTVFEINKDYCNSLITP